MSYFDVIFAVFLVRSGFMSVELNTYNKLDALV